MNIESYYKNKKVLVTGGLGFLGSNLALKLSALGAKVSLVDCCLPGHGGNPFNISDIRDGAEWINGDIRDESLMRNAFKGQEVVFNIAAQTSHTDSMKNPMLDADINIKGQLNLLNAFRETCPGARIVYCSSRAVYGSSDKKTNDENALPNPLDIYSTHKLAGEFFHKIYGNVFGLNACVLRVANGYGPRAQMKEPSFGILNWFMRLALDDREIKIFGDGMQVRDYAYVDDISGAFLAAGAAQDLKGEILNVGSGRGVPLIEIVRHIVRIAGKGKIVHVPWPEVNKKIDAGDFIADVDKIKKRLGWSPQTSLEDGLKITIGYYEKFRSHYW